MKIFLLAGQSIENREWIEEVEKEFKKEFSETHVQYYSHWDSGEKETNLEEEGQKFVDAVNSFDGEYLVFAKSIGSIIFLNSVERLKRKPKGALIVGLAYRLALAKGFDFSVLMDKVDFKTNIFQKESDPAGFLKEIEKLSGNMVTVEEYKCVNEEKDNHIYSNTAYLLKLMKETEL